MEVTPLTPASIIALKVLQLLFQKATSFEQTERRLQKLVEKYPAWQVGWYNLSSKAIVVVVAIPLHSVNGPWKEALVKTEEYRVSLLET